jgi:hypothetical protein
VPWRSRHDIDGAETGVLSQQGGLCSTDDLDALDIEQRRCEFPRPRDIRPIDEQADRALERGSARRGSQPAQRDTGLARIGRLLKYQARHSARQVQQRGRADALERFARRDVHGNRSILNRLASQAGGDDDLLDFAEVRALGPSNGHGGHGR